MKIGHKLRALRSEKGFSTLQIAERLDISDSTYRRYESDKSFPDIITLEKIAKIYDRDFTELLPEALTIINNNSGENANNAGYVMNQFLSEKLQEQFDERCRQYEISIQDKDAEIAFLRSLVQKK